jgi:RNA polymerase sigma-70 factor (ECF subfamily)
VLALAEPSDAELFARSREGDRAALARLVDRHKDGLVNYLARLAGSRDGAEDLAQETFLRLLERSGRYRERGQLRAYLYRIATNLHRSRDRRQRRWGLLQPQLAPADGHVALAEQDVRLLRREVAQRLAEALRELPLRYRVPVVLRDVEDWSYREIAQLLGCREGTVKSRIHRGRRLLRERLAPISQGTRTS